MSTFDNAITIHPYFKIKEGQMEACKSFLTQFCEKVASEGGASTTTSLSRRMCCSAERPIETPPRCSRIWKTAVRLLGEFGKITEVMRVEVHGPAAELEKLKAGLAGLNPEYFVCECGIGR